MAKRFEWITLIKGSAGAFFDGGSQVDLTQVAEVEGGKLYRTLVVSGGGKAISVALEFVPDVYIQVKEDGTFEKI